MSASPSSPTPTEPTARAAARPVSAALDIGDYVTGAAGDLHPGQAIALRLLDEPRSMGEMAEAMHCDNSNITGIVDRLEEREIVERRAAEHDRRVKLIALTPAGKRLREELNKRALSEILTRALDAAEER